ncbi:hypothetical protein D3C75_1222930 [compost metagenome]
MNIAHPDIIGFIVVLVLQHLPDFLHPFFGNTYAIVGYLHLELFVFYADIHPDHTAVNPVLQPVDHTILHQGLNDQRWNLNTASLGVYLKLIG